MKSPHLSIRWRLTIWYTVVLLFILGLVSLDIYRFMQHKVESIVQGKLENGYTTIEAVVLNSGGDLMDVVHLGQDMPFQLRREGRVAYVTTGWKHLEVPASLDSATSNPRSDEVGQEAHGYHIEKWESSLGHRYQIRIGKIPDYGFQLAYAQDVTGEMEILHELATVLRRAFPFAMILSIFGGYWLAGRALSPVRAVTKKAREITAESLSQRLPVANPHDEIGRLTEVFNETLARLENSFEQLRRFTADASHELRTPLTAIRSVGEVALQRAPEAESCREAIASMLVATESLSRLLDNLLILARGDTGKTQIRAVSLDLAGEMQVVTEELRILADEKRQSLQMEATTPIFAIADTTTLRLAVTNVLHNAIRYTPENGRITVRIGRTENGRAMIEIRDNGPGISVGEREKVFERFYRVDKARSRQDGGAGLGLAIAKWAVEANRGTVEFRDMNEPGACCRITLPVGAAVGG